MIDFNFIFLFLTLRIFTTEGKKINIIIIIILSPISQPVGSNEIH
jgi:hypothetical protein